MFATLLDHKTLLFILFLLIALLIPLKTISQSAPSQKITKTQQLVKKSQKKATGFDQVFIGKASWYGKPFHGRRTANGEYYNMNTLSAAHKKLNFDSIVKVTNLTNGESVVVRINDRGPYVKGRDIDLSYLAAKQLKMVDDGVVPVKLEILVNKQRFTYRQDYPKTFN